MENLHLQKSSKGKSEFPESEQNQTERIDSLIAKLARFYSVMGNAPTEAGALALMAELLCQQGSDGQIQIAMTRCARECRFPVRLPDVLQRIPGLEVSNIEAEMRKAWDVLIQFVDKFVMSNGEGAYSPQRHVVYGPVPTLNQRIIDSVRRSGGWRAYKCMDEKDYPFQQKRFFEEYQAWIAVERIANSKLLTDAAKPLLVAKSMPSLGAQSATTGESSSVTAPRPRKPEAATPHAIRVVRNQQPLSDAERQDRREMFRQQQQAWIDARNKSKPPAD